MSNMSNAGLGVLGFDAGRLEEKLAKMEADLRAAMSPAGTLGLDPLVDERRLTYGIPDGAFNHVAMYDRIIVAQLPETEGETFLAGGKVIMPERLKVQREKEAPRGIIISAGLSALDSLRSHGCGLGHIVRFIRNAPYRFTVDSVAGQEIKMLLLRAGDVVSSEDLYQSILAKRVRVETKSADIDGVIVRQHVFVDEQGQSWAPQSPWLGDDT